MSKNTRKRIFAPARASRGEATIAGTLAAVGEALALWLVWIHVGLKGESGAGGVCSLGGYFDCDVVNASRFSAIGGVPIAYLGAVVYAFLGGLAIAELSGSRRPRLIGYSRWLGTIAVAYSLYLAVVSVTVLRAACAFCIGLYAVNVGFAVLGWLGRSGQGSFTATVRDDLRTLFAEARAWPAKALFVVIVLGAVVVREVAMRSEARAAPATAGVHLRSTQVGVLPGHDEGPADSSIVVVEFTDLQCPRCEEANELVERLRRQYAGKARFVLKHFPIDRECNRGIHVARHDRACAAAEAAVCAGEQGRLWEFQGEVFRLGVSDEGLEDAARRSSLDVSRWRQCRWSSRARDGVLADVEDGLRIGVNATPTFLVGGALLRGTNLEERLAKAIDEEGRRQDAGSAVE